MYASGSMLHPHNALPPCKVHTVVYMTYHFRERGGYHLQIFAGDFSDLKSPRMTISMVRQHVQTPLNTKTHPVVYLTGRGVWKCSRQALDDASMMAGSRTPHSTFVLGRTSPTLRCFKYLYTISVNLHDHGSIVY